MLSHRYEMLICKMLYDHENKCVLCTCVNVVRIIFLLVFIPKERQEIALFRVILLQCIFMV